MQYANVSLQHDLPDNCKQEAKTTHSTLTSLPSPVGAGAVIYEEISHV